MSDEQNAEATEQTMEQIAGSVTEPAKEVVETKPDNVKDFQEFVAKQAKTNEDLQGQVETISKAHDELVNSQHRETVNKEIKGIAEKINEKVGGDADLAELFLEKQYNSDPSLKKIWDNRKENPEALEKALNIVSQEWAAKNQNLIDPQIAENQRALMASQSPSGRVQQDSQDDKLADLGNAEFLSTMRKMNRN